MTASRSAAPSVLSLEILGVPLRIECAEPSARERLEVCYSACAVKRPGNGAPLRAVLERGDPGYRVKVDGRDETHAGGLAEAVRAFNHELRHGVMLRARELFFVHAGVAALDGRAVVLPGVSGAGKSTVILALLQGGGKLLSDELLAYDRSTGLCRSFPRAIKIRDACVHYFPDLEQRFVGEGEGRFLPYSALPADVVAHAAPLHAVVVPSFDGSAPTRLCPMERGAALLELTASALNFGTHGARSLDFLTDLVREARAYRLSWRDPHEAARSILEHLRSAGG